MLFAKSKLVKDNTWEWNLPLSLTQVTSSLGTKLLGSSKLVFPPLVAAILLVLTVTIVARLLVFRGMGLGKVKT